MEHLGRRFGALWIAAVVLSTACGGAFPASKAPTAALEPSSAPTAALEPSPSRVGSGTVDGVSLMREMPYAVYLPRGYDTDPQRRYPVLYLLHGMDGSVRQWLDLGLATAADAAISAGDVQPFLVVMPEGERGYWMDQANGGPRWGSYVADDVVRTVDARYRTIARPEARAIGGLSMGGHGALQLSMNHPDLFRVVGAHSPALRREDQAMPYFGRGREFAVRDPISLVANRPDIARGLAIWIDIGDRDRWAPGALKLHEQLVRSNVAHRWRETAGDHASAYWSANLPEYLRFYGSAFASLR